MYRMWVYDMMGWVVLVRVPDCEGKKLWYGWSFNLVTSVV